MSNETLSPSSHMDAVTLRVGDLENMSSYYADAFAFTPVEERAIGNEVHRVLGRGDVPMVRLVHTPDLPVVNPREAGLFHTAFLFDSQASLAATVYRAAQDPRTQFTGSSDHLVSEAFYFTDPEGNGIELYRDRAKADWSYIEGQLQMATLFLDPNAYLQQHLTQEALDAGANAAGTVGHVHLQVGDLAKASDFYVNSLGFETTVATYPGALFASAGGYHHHLGMNTWNSGGAGPRAARLGLGDVAIAVPGREDLDALAERLRTRGLQFADTGASITVADPWGTQVTVSVAGRSAEDLLAS